MDIEKLKRFAENEFTGYQIAKAVTAVKNEVKDKEQTRDISMSDYFKTLREPLLEQQKKKTDEKQDKVIEQLRENQRALTEGIQDIVTLNKELPGIEVQKEKQSAIYDLGKDFNQDEIDYLAKHDLFHPSKLPTLTDEQFEDNKQKYDAFSTEIKYRKRRNTTDQKKVNKAWDEATNEEGKEQFDNLLTELMQEEEGLIKRRGVLQKYLEKINLVKKNAPLRVETSGEGVRKYRQTKRNAYKIQNNQYGGLLIDVPKLMNEMKINAYRGGQLVYAGDADKSLINLLTKRFNPRNQYSMNAVKIFNDLNMLSNIPKHKSSGKSRMVGSGAIYYKDPNELADRLKILIGSMAAGNNSPVLKNDISQINDELLKIGAIDKQMHEKLFNKYL